MIKLYFTFILAILGGSFNSSADLFRLKGLDGSAFQPATNVDIVWRATNDLPRALWVYKPIPQNFPMAVVSNLMAIGHFNWKNLTKEPDSFIPDRDLLRFVNKKEDWTSYLESAPAFGWIEYYAAPNSEPPYEGVPSRAEAKKLALDIFFKTGFDRSLLYGEHF